MRSSNWSWEDTRRGGVHWNRWCSTEVQGEDLISISPLSGSDYFGTSFREDISRSRCFSRNSLIQVGQSLFRQVTSLFITTCELVSKVVSRKWVDVEATLEVVVFSRSTGTDRRLFHDSSCNLSPRIRHGILGLIWEDQQKESIWTTDQPIREISRILTLFKDLSAYAAG